MTELTKQGIGTTTKHAEAISEEIESTLWEKGLLGSTSSKAIMRTMFFYNSKPFGLRGVDEHRNLSVDQFELGKDQTGSFILFKGRANKTYKEAGIDRYFTNHSGKRTCATTVYQAGVQEQEIMNRTDHRSVESVRKYKRASSEMLKDISNILEPSESMCKKIKHEDNTEIQNRTENQEISKSAAGGVGSLFTGCVFNFNSGS
ncbi:unnamed protein product [Mytilus edulis]|uniref:ZMYM2-like/QRICH1 C-terminal domain-containing protein n=1 Tax=Mytilus edulis TaxID=6550 RepID=A0A8S3QYK8_MYTED|nr:unnamed protein product [Mytilus edulis]